MSSGNFYQLDTFGFTNPYSVAQGYKTTEIVGLTLTLDAYGRAFTTAYYKDGYHSIGSGGNGGDLARYQGPERYYTLGYPRMCGNSYEFGTLELINRERQGENLNRYNCDPRVTQVAQNYTDLMCKLNDFGNRLDGLNWRQRIRRAGIRFTRKAKLLARGPADPREVFDFWMNGPVRRGRLLANYTGGFAGVGYRRCNGTALWTAVFVEPLLS